MLAAAPLASLLLGSREATGAVSVWRQARDGLGSQLGLDPHGALAWDAVVTALLVLVAAAVDGAGRGDVGMMRGLAHGWRTVHRVSAPRAGPTRPVSGAGQSLLAHAYFFASVALGGLVWSQGATLLVALIVAELYLDFSVVDYAIMSGAAWLVAAFVGLRFSPVSWVGGVFLYPFYALASWALRGWRVAILALLAAIAAAVAAWLAI
jgi:hypothetical protein